MSNTILVCPADRRGHTRFEWLDSRHTFSFGSYFDPSFNNFYSLRVINDDRVAPSGGFDMHPHKDMEIITYVLEGELEHQDSLGSRGVIKAGEFQYMNAGRGILHSEFNPSGQKGAHFLQIWIMPPARGLPPSYSEWKPPGGALSSGELIVASRGGALGGMSLHQDVTLKLVNLDRGDSCKFDIKEGRAAWIHSVSGQVDSSISEMATFRVGDAAGVGSGKVTLAGAAPTSQLLVFDVVVD